MFIMTTTEYTMGEWFQLKSLQKQKFNKIESFAQMMQRKRSWILNIKIIRHTLNIAVNYIDSCTFFLV